MNNMEIRKLSTAKLIPASYNPRKDLQPGDPEYEKLLRSVEEFGYVEPIVWNERTGNIVGGHQRLKVLVQLGYTEVECVVINLNEVREKALNVALNKISGEWDTQKLADLMHDIVEAGIDCTITGWDQPEIVSFGRSCSARMEKLSRTILTQRAKPPKSLSLFPNPAICG